MTFLLPDSSFIDNFVEKLREHVKLKAGSPSIFLAIEISSRDGNIYISQQRYIQQLLNKFNMADSNPIATPEATGQTLDEGVQPADSNSSRW